MKKIKINYDGQIVKKKKIMMDKLLKKKNYDGQIVKKLKMMMDTDNTCIAWISRFG